ncbi:hypothetical protein AA983_02910 [Dermacoccus sp. PE3]|nr:hypothetical protein AA983_02910 [Dermacoccus sp. PE3]
MSAHRADGGIRVEHVVEDGHEVGVGLAEGELLEADLDDGEEGCSDRAGAQVARVPLLALADQGGQGVGQVREPLEREVGHLAVARDGPFDKGVLIAGHGGILDLAHDAVERLDEVGHEDTGGAAVTEERDLRVVPDAVGAEDGRRLVGHVVEQGAAADAGGLGEVVHGEAVVPALDDEDARRRADLLEPLVGALGSGVVSAAIPHETHGHSFALSNMRVQFCTNEL